MAEKRSTFNPLTARDETVELYSVPSFENRRPEILSGSKIGSSKQHVEPGDILLCGIIPRINRAWVVGPKNSYRQVASTEWLRFQPAADLDSNYLRYFLSTEYIRQFLVMNASGVGGSLMRARRGTIAPLTFPKPPIEIQKNIVRRIDELFSYIDGAESALAEVRAGLDTYRKSLLNAAVTGQLTAKWRKLHPGRTAGEALLNQVNAHSPGIAGARQDSGQLPQIPTDWLWVNLGQLSDGSTRNGLSVKEALEPTAVKSLRLNALAAEKVNWATYRYLPRTLSQVSNYKIQHGDILVSRANGSPSLVGRASRCDDPPPDTIFPDTAIRYRLKGGAKLQLWVLKMWNSDFVRKQILHRAKTTAGILKVSQEDIASIVFPLPGIEEISVALSLLGNSAFAKEPQGDFMSLYARIGNLRQSILSAAFRGELVS